MSQDVTHPTAPVRGREHSQPCIGQCREDVESSAAVSTEASLSPHRGPSQASSCAQHCGGAKLGRKCAVEEAFPTVLR